MRLAKLIYLAIPQPPAGSAPEVVMAARTQASNAFREYLCTLFPDLTDQEFDKEGELSEFLKRFASKPFELRITEDRRGNFDVSLQR